ncbi:hypothetical protein ACM66B_004932 [Microbotryomycetes sp. NB124-2]
MRSPQSHRHYNLPSELLLVIVRFASDDFGSNATRSTASLALVSKVLVAPVQVVLLEHVRVSSLASFDCLLHLLESGTKRRHSVRPHTGDDDDDAHSAGWGQIVRTAVLVNTHYAERGWGPRVGRLLAQCTLLQQLSITGVDDLRMKWFTGTGCLTSLKLVSSSFRAHALAEPPSLPACLESVKSLHLSNLGLPEPSTHLAALVSNSASTLVSLSLSSVRDVGRVLFRRVLEILANDCPHLQELRLGALLSEQIECLASPLPLSNGEHLRRPAALACLPVTRLTFTIPHIDLTLLSALPNTLTTLTLRTSPGLSSVLSTPISSNVSSTGHVPIRIPIEQLEEESHVAYMLSEALSSSALKLETVVWEGPSCRRQAMERKLRQALDRAGRTHVVVSSETSL